MRQIQSSVITEAVKNLCIKANFYLREDVRKAIKKACEVEESPLGKEILQTLIKNAEIAAKEKLSLCQDTGSTTVFLEIGQEVAITGEDLVEAVNRGVHQGYQQGYLRKSMVTNPLFARENTSDNTPALIYPEIVRGDRLKIEVMPKGAGCDNVSRLKMLNPGEGLDGVKRFVLDSIEEADGNPCPPIVVGLGIGGSFDQAPILAKKALLRKIGGPSSDKKVAQLERELLAEINRLGIGPMGLGGKTTALGVAIEVFPAHMASLPVALDISCHSLRSAQVNL